jgi:subtilisin family serine protease
MKRLIIASCVATLLTLAVTGGVTFTGARAEKTNKYQPFGAPGDFVRGRVLVKFRDDIGTDHARQIIAALGARDADEIPHIGVHILDLPYQASEAIFLSAFKARGEVEFAELDRLLPLAQMSPNDPFYLDPNAWALQKISAPDAWTMNTGSPGIIIAILDTGIESTHPDLSANMVPGWNIVNNNADTTDVQGHGTMVAGTAAASTNNSVGVAAVAWNCRIMPVRIADSSGYATVSDVADGLTWAANHGARVANISFNANGYSTISSAAKYFQSQGGVVAVAAGNGGTSVQTADDPYMLTVGATDSSDTLFSWSNRGNNLDVVAPGHVATTGPGGTYAAADGTSFAAPIVAGAAALLLSANPSLTPVQVQNILEQSSDDLGLTDWDSTYGYGRINLARALSMAAGTGGVGGNGDSTPPTIVITSPSDGSTVSSVVSVSVSATDNVGVVKVELYVDGSFYGSSTKAPFTIKWNTRKASRGSHALESKAYDAMGNVGNSPDARVYK